MWDRRRGSEERYSAFVSYAHPDRSEAARLATRLERYRLPRQVAQALGYRRLRPVFRDRDELRATHDLGEAIKNALARSDFLVVVCSRHTPASAWVGREIALFRSLHGDGQILTARIDGPAGLFHPCLTRGAAGEIIEPLSADFTAAGDGPRLALLKLIAAIANVDFDDLVGRDGQRLRRQRTIAAVAAALILTAAAVAAWAIWRARSDAAAERDRSTEAVQYQLTRLRAEAQARGSLAFAETINQGVERSLHRDDRARHTLGERLQIAALLQARAEDEEKRGRFHLAARHAQAALTATSALALERGNDSRVLFHHAQSAYWVGFVAWRTGDIAGAARGFRTHATLAHRLVRLEPCKAEWRLEQGYANSNAGTLALRETRDWEQARVRFTAAQQAFREAARQQPDDAATRFDLADGEAWLADTDRLRGDLRGARAHRLAQRRLLAGLMARDPTNARYRAALIGNRLGLARLTLAEGQADAAIGELEQARAIAADLQRQDPDDRSIARNVRATELFLAKARLQVPPAADRPVDPPLDCAADWRVPRGEELAAFCTLVAAQRDILAGRPDAARRRLAAPRAAAALRARSLSPRWQLDFAAERAALDRAIASAEGERR